MSARLVLAALAALAALALAGSAGAVNVQRYADPAGDAGGAPDVTQVTVANTSAGELVVGLAFANRPVTGISGEDVYLVGFDTDRNARTGDGDGSEFVVVVHGTEGAALGRWAGETYDWETPQRTLQADGAGFRVNISELGGARSFDLWVVTELGEEQDVAPDGVGVYTFTVDLKPLLVAFSYVVTPKQPVAGKLFTLSGVRVETETGANAAAGTFTCTAKLAGKVLKPTAKCRWKLPPGSKGKTLAVTVTMTYKGTKATSRPITFKVR